jgi:putative phosphoesterase
MKVAAIYDIHGNLPALEAVIEDIRQAEADHVVVGGDVLPGPMPCETLELLFDLDMPVQFIQGNGEREVLALLEGKEMSTVPEQYKEIMRWTAEQLTPEYERLLSNWQKTIAMEIQGIGDVMFCHATPRDDNEIFTKLTPEENLLHIFQDVKASLVVCGHTHIQFDRMIGNVRVVNAGSVGMPFGKTGADWLLIEIYSRAELT